MKNFWKKYRLYAGAGLLALTGLVAAILFWGHKSAPPPDVKFTYTLVVDGALLDEGHWEGLLEPLKSQFPDVQFVLRPRMQADNAGELPPFDFLIGPASMMEEAQAHQQLAANPTAFYETGYQMLYARRDQMPELPENWALLNLKAQVYLNSAQEKFLLAAADQAQTFLPLLLGNATATTPLFELMRDLRLSYRAVPLGCPLACALRLFEEGKSPLFWGTDRYLGEIAGQVGSQLVLAPLPKLDTQNLKTPRQTIFVAGAAHPTATAEAVTQALSQAWLGPKGSALIFKELHRLASADLQNPQPLGEPLRDQLKVIVRDFTVPMDARTQQAQSAHLRPLVNTFLAAELSTADAAEQADRMLQGTGKAP